MPSYIRVSMITPDMIPDRSIPHTKLALKTLTRDEMAIGNYAAVLRYLKGDTWYIMSAPYANPVVTTDPTEYSTKSTTYVEASTIRIMGDITSYDYSIDLKTGTVDYTAYGQIRKNGVAWGPEHSNSTTTYTTFTGTLGAANNGDQISAYQKALNVNYAAYLKNWISKLYNYNATMVIS